MHASFTTSKAGGACRSGPQEKLKWESPDPVCVKATCPPMRKGHLSPYEVVGPFLQTARAPLNRSSNDALKGFEGNQGTKARPLM